MRTRLKVDLLSRNSATIFFMGPWIFLMAGGFVPDSNWVALSLLAIFTLAVYTFVFHNSNQAEDWKLQLPLPPRELLTQQLLVAALRICAATMIALAIGIAEKEQPLAKVAPPILTIAFATLCFLLLQRFPTAQWSMFPLLQKLPALTWLNFVVLIVLSWKLFKGPPPYSLPLFAALFAVLVWLIYRRLPVAFLLAPDASKLRDSEAPATSYSESNSSRLHFWVLYIWRTGLWQGLFFGAYLGAALVFLSPASLMNYCAIFCLDMRDPNVIASFAHAPKSRRLVFALQKAPLLILLLLGALVPLLLFPGHKPLFGDWVDSSQYRFTTHPGERSYKQELWPLPGLLVPCQQTYIDDPAEVREALRDCYGFEPGMDLAPYLDGDRRLRKMDWDKFWKDHPRAPNRFAYRLADLCMLLASIFAVFFFVYGLRLGEKSTSKYFDIVRRYPKISRWSIVWFWIFAPFGWMALGMVHALVASMLGGLDTMHGALGIGFPLRTAIAAMLPADHSHAVGMLIAACAVLYFILQELDARCDAI